MNWRKIRRYGIAGLMVAVVLLVILWPRHEKKAVLRFGMFSDSNWNVDSDNTTKIIEAAIQKFEKVHPGVEITYESGIQKEDYTEWLDGKFLTGKEPDVFLVPADTFNALASKGALLELTDFMEEDSDFQVRDFYESGIASGQYEKKQYALPYESVPLLMCVNTTLLDRLEIELPENNWTWGDFHAICRKVTRDTDSDGRQDQFGVYNYTWKDAAYSNGASLFDENGMENYVSNQNVVNAVNFVYKINSLTNGYAVTEQDFEAGDVAFTPMLLTNYRMYKNYPYSIEKYTGFSWTCIPMPAGPKGDNMSEVDTLSGAISKRTNHQKLAWEFLKVLTYDEDIQKLVASESKGASALKMVTEDQSVYNQKEEIDTSLPALAMENGVTVPKFPKYEEAVKRIDEGVTEAMNSDKNIRASLITLQKTVNSYLKNE